MWIGSGGNSDNIEQHILGSGFLDYDRCMAVKGIGAGGKGAYQYVSTGWISGHTYRLSVYFENLNGVAGLNYSIGYALGSSSNGETATYGSSLPGTANWAQVTTDFVYSGSSGVTIFLRAVNAGSSERAGFDFVQVTDLTPDPTSTPTAGPSPTPTATPPPVSVLRQGNDGGGVQLYFAAAAASKIRDDRGGGATIDTSDISVPSATSAFAPVATDASVGYLDNIQCATDGEVRNFIGWCTSNNRLSPLGNMSLTKPDFSGMGVVYNITTQMSQVSSPDPRVPFNEQSTSYQSWVQYSISSAELLNATRVFLWFRAHKPVIQSNTGENTNSDDSYWVVGSPEQSETNRNLFYLADDGNGFGDNDGPALLGASAELFGNCGTAKLGIGQWFWGNTRLDNNSDLGADWCSLSSRKLGSENNRVCALHTTIPDDGNGKGIVRFYLVGRESETLAESIKLDIACISTVGPTAFVPNDSTWQSASVLAPAANVKSWREMK